MAARKFITFPDQTDMPHTADVVIIGGGPAGTAALWAIERYAPGTRAVLIEKSDRLGAGSSTASLENYRSCWPTVCLARQMTRSIDIYHHADDYLGEGARQAIALKQQGYLFCAFTEKQAEGLRDDVRHLHSIGLPHIEYLDASEVRYRFGPISRNIVAAKFDPVAGWLDSNALIHAYARSTNSAQIILNVPEVHLQTEQDHIAAVQIPGWRIATRQVIIAAGASSRAIGKTAGVDIPVMLRPRQSFTTGWRHADFPEGSPMLIGAHPYPHVRPEAQSGAIFGWEYNWHNKRVKTGGNETTRVDALDDPVEPVGQLKDPRFPSITLMLLAKQFGHSDGQGFADSRYLRGISHNIGYYVQRDETAAWVTNPDGSIQPYDSERAIIDAHPAVEGLYLSVGHVGHGIMSSAAAAEILACKLFGLPLKDPSFADFGIGVNWVEHDKNAL